MPLLYHAYVYLEFLILACTIYIPAPFLPFPVTSDFAMYIRKPRISGAVLVEARSMTYGDLGAKAFLSVLVVVSH